MKNLTIAYGGILQMFCVGFTETYTMAVPLQVLKSLAADELVAKDVHIPLKYISTEVPSLR